MGMNKNFAWPITETYSGNIAALQNCLDVHGYTFLKRGIALFGSGIHGCEFLKLLEQRNYPVRLFIDNNKDKQGGCINQYPILSFDQYLALPERPVILIAVESFAAIRTQLLAAGLLENIEFFCVEEGLLCRKENTNAYEGL